MGRQGEVVLTVALLAQKVLAAARAEEVELAGSSKALFFIADGFMKWIHFYSR